MVKILMSETTLKRPLNHRPLGFEAPYTHGPDERFPRWPQAGQPVSLGLTVPLNDEPEQVYCLWRLNGAVQPALPLRKLGLAPRQASPFLAVSPLNEAGLEAALEVARGKGEESQLCWEAGIGPFVFGDRVEYTFSTSPQGDPVSENYEFSFETRAWQKLQLVSGQSGQLFLLWQEKALLKLSPKAGGESTFCLELERVAPDAAGLVSAKLEEFLIVNGSSRLVIDGQSGAARLLLGLDSRNSLQSADPMFEGLLTPGGELKAVRLNFSERGSDFYGLGERFDRLNQRGLAPDIRVYEQYKDQGDRTYFPIPFGFSPDGFGLYLATSANARFNLPQDGPQSCEVELPGQGLNLYLFSGSPRQILDAYTRLTGKPVLPPDWIYTPWISGNEWNSQAKIMQEVLRSEAEGVPVGVVVIEAWADETTFYVFNDAAYSPGDPAQPLHLADFTFPAEGHWPDPKGMIDELHRRGIKVVLWQIPVFKSFEEVEQSMAERALAGQKPQLDSLEQHRRDTAYAVEHGYVVRDADGQPYRNPGIWFNGAYVLDVTNPAAREWWMSRRAYLMDELGVDGFKTDGGEHLWGNDLRFHDGRRGAEMINAYPQVYTQMYFDALKAAGRNGVTFSRAGFTGSQNAPCHWAGDENSTYEAFRHSIVAGLSAGLSGIPFWGWDIGGFSGPLPTSELFLRATGMAAFCPIMQYHSEYNAFRPPLRDRTPWNVADQNGTPWLVEAYARLSRLRMELLPYIQAAGRRSAETGEPLMRALVLDWPEDLNCRQIEDQYLFGPAYLVAPVVEENATARDVYLPAGQWRDFWDGPDAPLLEGGRWLKDYPAPLLEKPVLVFEKVAD
jgi:alpha-glucosidase (family GH31 glycosyl hydrolase)